MVGHDQCGPFPAWPGRHTGQSATDRRAPAGRAPGVGPLGTRSQSPVSEPERQGASVAAWWSAEMTASRQEKLTTPVRHEAPPQLQSQAHPAIPRRTLGWWCATSMRLRLFRCMVSVGLPVPNSPSTLGRVRRFPRQDKPMTVRTAEPRIGRVAPRVDVTSALRRPDPRAGPSRHHGGGALATPIWRSRRISPRTSHLGGFFPCRTGQSDGYGGIPQCLGRGLAGQPRKALIRPFGAAYSGRNRRRGRAGEAR